MFSFLIILGSILLGIICSLCINRLLIIKKENKSKSSNDVKSELNNLVFEKSIALEALNKINQYFEEKKIDVYEKDRLLLKYGKLLDHYDERIFKLQPIFEVQEIYEYRKQLYSLISDSIAKLDERLSNISNNFNYNQENDTNINKIDNTNKTNFSYIPITRKITTTGKSDLTNSDTDSLLSFDKSKKKDVNLVNSTNKNSMMFSTVVGKTVDTNDKNDADDGDYELNDVSDTKKDDFGDFNVEEINKIQKDVLKILQRLENPSAKI